MVPHILSTHFLTATTLLQGTHPLNSNLEMSLKIWLKLLTQWLKFLTQPMILKVWSPDQQYQHRLGTC